MEKEKAFLLTLTILACYFAGSIQAADPYCPTSTGSLITNTVKISVDGDIRLQPQQDSHCYNYTLEKSFNKLPNVALALTKFQAESTSDLYLSIKPMPEKSKSASTLSQLLFSVKLYKAYTTWNMVEFKFIAEDKSGIEAGYYLVDGARLSGCELGKNVEVYMPLQENISGESLKVLTFIHGFEISTKSKVNERERSPLQIQIINRVATRTTVTISLTVTSMTQVYNVLVSYIVYSKQQSSGILSSGKYSYDNYAAYPSNTPQSPSYQIPDSPSTTQTSNEFYGISGLIINYSTQSLLFDSYNYRSLSLNFKVNNYWRYFTFEYLFFEGGACGGCHGYPIQYKGNCIEKCPISTFSDGFTCVFCVSPDYWNGTHCVVNKPQQCTGGQTWNAATWKCECPYDYQVWTGAYCAVKGVDCFGGQVYNQNTRVCECTSGNVWNGTACIAAAPVDSYGCTAGKSWNQTFGACVCNPGTAWNGAVCIPTSGSTSTSSGCTGGRVWNSTLGACACSSGNAWNGAVCLPIGGGSVSISSCTGGRVWNSTLKVCSCRNDETWNGNQCVKRTVTPINCQNNEVWNGSQCVKRSVAPITSGSTTSKPECQGGQEWNSTKNGCFCPIGYEWNGASCTRTQCPVGQIWNISIGACSCSYGTYWDGNACTAAGSNPNGCYGGKFFNPVTQICQCKSNAYELPNGNCIQCAAAGSAASNRTECKCQYSPDNTYWNGQKCIECGPDRFWNSHLSICDCEIGSRWDGYTCVKDLCDNGYIQKGGKCKCPTGNNLINGVCVPPSDCPAGKVWDSYKNACEDIVCNSGTVFNAETNVCEPYQDGKGCPYETYWNGLSCVSYAEQCPKGTKWTGQYCETTNPSCKKGYYTQQNGSCSTIPAQCPVQLVFKPESGFCVPNSNQCPNMSYYNGFSCLPYGRCQSGMKWSQSEVRCVCPQTSHYNGEKCVPCQGNQVYGKQGCGCPSGLFFNGSVCIPINSESKCKTIPYSSFNRNSMKCDCLPGFDKYKETCICSGLILGDICNKCAQKPNSQWTDGICKCNQGYFESSDGVCIEQKYAKVSSPPPMIGSGYIPTPKKNIQCNVGNYFEPQEQECALCSDGCLSCQDCYVCKQCRPEYNYFYSTQSCVEKCGDGKRFSLECDDGNNEDGDGCSSDCKIESGNTCFGGSPNSRDMCTTYKPDRIEMKITGQTHIFGKIVLNVKLNYLPTNLTLNDNECTDNCDKVLLVNITSGYKTYTSIKSSYIKTTSYSFGIEIEFGREPIGLFTAEISISEAAQEKYFPGIKADSKIVSEVNPAYMARVDFDKKEDVLS